MKPSELKVSVREMVLFGILGAMTFAAKYVMSFLPNIEPSSLMVMLFAVVFGKKWVYPTYLYVAMEILFYGINLWSINYLYIWAILAIAAYCLRGMQSAFGWAMVSGVFGLLFGVLCGIVDVFIGGFSYAVTKWISGIPFDIAHCIGNFAIALVMFRPLRKLLEQQYAKLMHK
jgi:energy-coupling factor transport system substrate-specific component